MLRLSHRSRDLWSIVLTIASIGSAGCFGNRRESLPPRPLAVTIESVNAPVDSQCVDWTPTLPSATSGLPLPTAAGELSLVDVRGDDRFAHAHWSVSAWSADGAYWITAQRRGLIVWDTETGRARAIVPFADDGFVPRELVLSDDGQLAAVSFEQFVEGSTASLEKKDANWKMRVISPFGNGVRVELPRALSNLRFTSDGTHLLSTEGVVDVPSGTFHAHAPFVHGQRKVIFHPDGRRAFIFSSGDRVRVELRDLATGAVIRVFTEIASGWRASISGDGSRIGVLTKQLHVFATDTGARVASIDEGKDDGTNFALSYDGTKAVAWDLPVAENASRKKFVVTKPAPPPPSPPTMRQPNMRMWDLAGAKRLWAGDREPVGEWVFTRDAKFLKAPRPAGSLTRVDTGEDVKLGAEILALSPDSKRAIAEGENGLRLYDTGTQKVAMPMTFASRVLARSEDGRLVASRGADGALQLERDGSCRRIRDDARGRFAFSRDGQLLLNSGELSEFEKLTAHFSAWRTTDGALVNRMHALAGAMNVLVPSRNEVWFQGQNGEIRKFNAASGALVGVGRSPRTADSGSFAWDVRDAGGDRASRARGGIVTRDGLTLVMADYLDKDAVLSIWNLVVPEKTIDMVVNVNVTPLVLSPDERTIASVGTSGLHLWSIGGREIATKKAPNGKVKNIAYCPDGSRIASAAEDGRVLIFNAKDGTVVGSALLPFDYGKALWCGPDSQSLIVDTARGLRVRFAIGSTSSP